MGVTFTEIRYPQLYDWTTLDCLWNVDYLHNIYCLKTILT